MEEARVDERTELVAQILAAEQDYLLIEFMDAAMRQPLPALDPLYFGYAARAHPTLAPALATLRVSLDQWRQTLQPADLGRRKGAVVERLVALLLERRMGLGTARRECAIDFKDGTTSLEFDVLGLPTRGRWEGVECKWSHISSESQAQRLGAAARSSQAEGGGLLVAVATTKSVIATELAMRRHGLCGLVSFAAGSALLQLAADPPPYQDCQK